MSETLDRFTLEAQLHLLVANHKDLLGSLERCNQKIADVQKAFEVAQREAEQYKGALSYSQHVQEQTHKILEQVVAAKMAAKLAAESAIKNGIASAPSTT